MPAASSPSTTASPARGVQSLQLEINRALYLDEATLAEGKASTSWRGPARPGAARVFATLPLLLERRAAAE